MIVGELRRVSTYVGVVRNMHKGRWEGFDSDEVMECCRGGGNNALRYGWKALTAH